MARENIRAWTLVLVALQLVATATSAGGEPSDPARAEARAHFRNGARLIRVGAYAAAVAEFSEAYRLYPNERFHYDLAQAYRLEHNNQQAVAHYRRYLAAVHEGELAADARQQLSALGAAEEMEASPALQASADPLRLPSPAGGDTAVEPASPPPSLPPPSLPPPSLPPPSLPPPSLPPPSLPPPSLPQSLTQPGLLQPSRSRPAPTRQYSIDVLATRPDVAPKARPKPAYKKWWPWTIGGLAITGAAIGLGFALTPHPPAATIGKVTL